MCFDPSFFERGVPSPTRRKPTRLAAEVIHFPVTAFSIVIEVGVEVRKCPFVPETGLTLVLDAMVGVIKLALALFSEWEGVFFGVCNGEPASRGFLLTDFEVISVRVPMAQTKPFHAFVRTISSKTKAKDTTLSEEHKSDSPLARAIKLYFSELVKSEECER